MILHNVLKPFSKLVYDDDDDDDGNVSTYKILGSLEILAIKNQRFLSFQIYLHVSSRCRMVKVLDLKSNGIFPCRLEPCQLQNMFLAISI